MKIKTYQALTMQEALKQIKAELGPDAVIMSTRQTRATSGTLALLGRQLVEVTAAIDVAPLVKRGQPTSVPSDAPPTPSFEEALQSRLTDAGPPLQSVRRSLADHGPEWDEMREELGRIREAMERMTKGERTPAAPSMPVARNLDLVVHDSTPVAETPSPKPLPYAASFRQGASSWLEDLPHRVAAVYYDLVSKGMAADYAKQLVSTLSERRSTVDPTSDTAVRHALRYALAQEILVAGPLLTPEERKKTVILVGPTGAGKTTTIAKMAAHYRFQEHRKVVLITLDTYRMAAVEQLRAYARLLDVPLEVALTKADAISLLRKHDKAELVLIDTMGRSPRDQAGMDELKRLISMDHPAETHLVLSATTRQRDLLDTFARFSEVPIHRLLFTKLDETSSYGALASVVRRTRVPLSYLGIGQEVPDDFLVARAEAVADLIMGEPLPAPAPRSKKEKITGREETQLYDMQERNGAGRLRSSSSHASPLTPHGS